MTGPASLRRTLLLGILGPVLVLVALNGVSLYGRALAALNTAYDRTLLASAKSIGEELDVVGEGRDAVLRSTVPYSALEAFEADTRNRLFYRVSSLQGELVSGFPDLPFWRGQLPAQPPFQALVDFYDDRLGADEVRVAVLLQPVSGARGRGMAVIQVAETLELRRAAARRILLDTLWRQALLVAVIAAVVVLVVQRATRPVRGLSARLAARPEEDLTPLPSEGAPRELLPLLEATNGVMARLARLLAHRQRFVRDAAHQLRTPLAVLKAQVQSGLRGDVDARQALQEAALTVDRATELANQMLALAKVEQLRGGRQEAVHDFGAILRELALEVSPLVAQRDLEFEIDVRPAPVRAHAWMLRELGRNLLHNAIRHSPVGAPLSVRLVTANGWAALTVADRGPGIAAELRERLFQPFAAGDARSGSGLGLAICAEIVQALGGAIALDNRLSGSRISGLDATVRLPLATIGADGQASH